jgi:hypothetical protein
MLGINARSEFVHRDNLVLIRGQRQ